MRGHELVIPTAYEKCRGDCGYVELERDRSTYNGHVPIASKPAITFLLPTGLISKTRHKLSLYKLARSRNQPELPSHRRWYSSIFGSNNHSELRSSDLPIYNEFKRNKEQVAYQETASVPLKNLGQEHHSSSSIAPILLE